MASDTITIGCKLPHGLHLDVHTEGQAKKRVTVKGNNSSLVIGGYGITDGVPKEHWEAWLEQHKSHPAVTNSLIFAHTQTNSVKARALEQAELKNGLEGMDPKNMGKGLEVLTKE